MLTVGRARRARGVKNSQKLADVIYERYLTVNIINNSI